jgi:hypothetical protein
MLTALIIFATATALILTATVLTIVTGWFPRLAALAARGLEAFLRYGCEQPRLSPRDRSELIARLWVP